MDKRLTSVEEVVESLYGTGAEMARQLGRSRTSIWKWQYLDEIPGALYGRVQERAAEKGFEVPDELFTPVTVHPRLIAKRGA